MKLPITVERIRRAQKNRKNKTRRAIKLTQLNMFVLVMRRVRIIDIVKQCLKRYDIDTKLEEG